ncbi:glycosyltransferase family 1 protein [Mycena floridula]|nr:glycosyltransferase family 1 protein [Mycena floridula]
MQDDSPPEYPSIDVELDPKIDFTEFKSPDGSTGLTSSAHLTQDGLISISLNLKTALPDLPPDYAPRVDEFAVDAEFHKFPKMNILVMIVGSRGDVQPYIALGKRLLRDGHRVRIATHETFRSFVGEAGLEFFAIGGNPQELMSYMVKNPGLVPGVTSLTNGDISKKRKMLKEMINGCWLACHSPCPVTRKKFAADAIISNPPAFAHIHCAEALGIPLLLSFSSHSNASSPTTSFPHPLVNVKESNAENRLTNLLSYTMAELLTWQGFVPETLKLSPLSLRSGPGLADTLKIPWTYCMSSALVPKPADWKNHIDVVGFYFLDLATNFHPPGDLEAFLAAGSTPVYIGQVSVCLPSMKSDEMIFEATAKAGVRALVSAGWGGIGGTDIPSNVFILGNIPHDWLFDKDRVKAVVHHGGAGTTSAGLLKGLPTVVVPFFGDQGFWGNMIHKSGAGPAPIPHKKLTAENLAEAIKFAIGPSAKAAAKRMGEQIASENGVEKGVESFYRHLPLKNMRCDIDPSRVAVWWSTEHCLKLSAFVVHTLVQAKKLHQSSLDPHRTKEYDTQKPVSDPITGGASAIFWTVTHYYGGIAEIFYSPINGVVHTTTAIPLGVMKIVTSVHEGFQNVPNLLGSEPVRAPGKVTDFQSGIKEAGKGLFYGYYDGITGLIREPVQGAKKEVRATEVSVVNVTMRPAAGIVGVVSHPLQGAWKSLQGSVAREEQKTRMSDGEEAFRGSSRMERAEVLEKFDALKARAPERQRAYRELAEKVLYGEATQIEDRDAASTSRLGEESEDAIFERDLEKAKQLSLVDQ